jgi:hypothetical protein
MSKKSHTGLVAALKGMVLQACILGKSILFRHVLMPAALPEAAAS